MSKHSTGWTGALKYLDVRRARTEIQLPGKHRRYTPAERAKAFVDAFTLAHKRAFGRSVR